MRADVNIELAHCLIRRLVFIPFCLWKVFGDKAQHPPAWDGTVEHRRVFFFLSTILYKSKFYGSSVKAQKELWGYKLNGKVSICFILKSMSQSAKTWLIYTLQTFGLHYTHKSVQWIKRANLIFFLFSFRGKRGAVCLTRSENNDDAERTTKVRHEPPFVFPHIGFASTFDAFCKVRFPKVGWILMSGAKDVYLLRGRRCFIKTHGWVFFDEQISLNHYLRIKLLKRKRRLFDCLR